MHGSQSSPGSPRPYLGEYARVTSSHHCKEGVDECCAGCRSNWLVVSCFVRFILDLGLFFPDVGVVLSCPAFSMLAFRFFTSEDASRRDSLGGTDFSPLSLLSMVPNILGQPIKISGDKLEQISGRFSAVAYRVIGDHVRRLQADETDRQHGPNRNE